MSGEVRPWRRLLREPLLHFMLFGALVVGLDARWGGGAPAADDMVIHVTPEVLARLHHEHESTFGRAPSQQELDEAVTRWTDVEMLVLEARRLGLDRSDPRVRTRLAERMAYVMAALEVPPEPTEAELRAAYEADLDGYVLEARYTLRQLYVAGLETASRQAAEALKRRWDQGEDPRDLGEAADAPPGGPVLRGRTPERLTELFGAGFTAVVEAAEVGERHVVASGTGWHVVEVEKRRPRQRASFEEARDRVSVRWKTARLEGLKDAAVARLRARYTVRDATP